MRAAAFRLACLVSVLASPTPLAEAGEAQHPRVINGRLVPHAAGSSLDSAFHRLVAAQTQPAEIGYSVPPSAAFSLADKRRDSPADQGGEDEP